MTTAAALLDEILAFGERAGAELVPTGALRASRTAVQMLAAAQPEFALELHVASERPVVDLTLRVHRRHAHALLDHAPDSTTAVQRVLHRWMTPESALSRSPFIEFEFDLEDEPGAPWIGPAIEPELRRGPVWIQEARDRGQTYSGPRPADPEQIVSLLRELGSVDARTAERVMRLAAALPRHGLLSQLALLDGRPSSPREGVRVFVSVPASDLEATLTAAGWPGDVARLAATRRRFSPDGEWIDVDFGIAATHTEPNVSFYREFQAPRLADSALRAVLETIATLSLTTTSRLEALKAWVVDNDMRVDRIITFKVTLLPGALRLKVYLSNLGPPPSYDGLDSR